MAARKPASAADVVERIMEALILLAVLGFLWMMYHVELRVPSPSDSSPETQPAAGTADPAA